MSKNKALTDPMMVISMRDEGVIVEKRTGVRLALQRMYGLLLKRFYYARHRHFLLLIQLFLPLITVIVALYINNTIGAIEEYTQPPLLMDPSTYKRCVAIFTQNPKTTQNPLETHFRSTFPPPCTIIDTQDPIKFIEQKATEHFRYYRDRLLMAAIFDTESAQKNVRILYNNHFKHTLPLAVNVVHNTILKFLAKNEKISLQVENAPLLWRLETKKTGSGGGGILGYLRAIVMGIFMPIGLTLLVASFVVFVVHENASKCKHVQFMTGLGEVSFWFGALLWDFGVCIVACVLAAAFFVVYDTTKMFNCENIGVIFLFLLLYCFASVPFVYFFSRVFNVPASGFTTITIVNLAAGMILGIWMFVYDVIEEDPWDLKWLFSIIPNYVGAIAFMKIVLIADINKYCDVQDPNFLKLVCSEKNIPYTLVPCCAEVCNTYDACFEKTDYFLTEIPGLGSELATLAVLGVIYSFLSCFFDSSFWYMIRQAVNKMVARPGESVTSKLDSDVLAEKNRIRAISSAKVARNSDYLIVRDLTKSFRKLRAVDGLSFGVTNGTCFGLLGINGAGKTTTFRQLTGDLLVDFGDAIIQENSITKNKSKYLSNIGYCPQFDALIDHLTGKEMLRVFANLHGIKKTEIKDVVNRAIVDFDLASHADKLTLAYSGGNKRKLSTAISFIGQPAVVFLDEPTTGVDPMARRKLWNMIKSSNNAGTAVVLTSHSMEECEVLCSRVGIMVNGQFQCLGPIQYLKNKFSQGFTIQAKLKDGMEAANNQNELQKFIEAKFPSAVLKDVHQGLVTYQVVDPSTKLTQLFTNMQEAKSRFDLEDYSVSQATLEQVFLSFARKQR